MPQVYGIGGTVNAQSAAIKGRGAPSSAMKASLGQQYFDISTFPASEYTFNGATWVSGGNAYATTTTPGIVTLSTDIVTDYPSDTKVLTVTTTKDYVDSVVAAGAPVATETTAGIGQLATDAEAIA